MASHPKNTEKKFTWNAVQKLLSAALVILGATYLLNGNLLRAKNPRKLTGTQNLWHEDTVYVVRTTIDSVYYNPAQTGIAEPDPR